MEPEDMTVEDIIQIMSDLKQVAPTVESLVNAVYGFSIEIEAIKSELESMRNKFAELSEEVNIVKAKVHLNPETGQD